MQVDLRVPNAEWHLGHLTADDTSIAVPGMLWKKKLIAFHTAARDSDDNDIAVVAATFR